MPMALVALVYVGFAAMGLPEAPLGASWPAMGSGLHASLAAVIRIPVVIAAGAMWAALAGEPWLRRWGSGRSVDVGVACTVVALLGFSFTPSYWLLLFFAVPYGVGSGLLALALNAYIALRLPSAHIIWMHATTAAGAMAGHTMLGWIIANDADWRWAYRCIGLVQLALAIVLVSATKLWRDELTPIQRATFGMQAYGERDWHVDAHTHGRLGASPEIARRVPDTVASVRLRFGGAEHHAVGEQLHGACRPHEHPLCRYLREPILHWIDAGFRDRRMLGAAIVRRRVARRRLGRTCCGACGDDCAHGVMARPRRAGHARVWVCPD